MTLLLSKSKGVRLGIVSGRLLTTPNTKWREICTLSILVCLFCWIFGIHASGKKYHYIFSLFNTDNHRKLRLIDTNLLKKHEGAFDLQEFKYVCNKSIDNCKSILLDQYYYAVTDVFLQGAKKNKLPDPAKRKRVKSFFNSVATIMTNQLQTLCMKSLYDYLQYITDIKVCFLVVNPLSNNFIPSSTLTKASKLNWYNESTFWLSSLLSKVLEIFWSAKLTL